MAETSREARIAEGLREMCLANMHTITCDDELEKVIGDYFCERRLNESGSLLDSGSDSDSSCDSEEEEDEEACTTDGNEPDEVPYEEQFVELEDESVSSACKPGLGLRQNDGDSGMSGEDQLREDNDNARDFHCGCKLYTSPDGAKECIKQFEIQDVVDMKLSMMELAKHEKDLILMAKVSAAIDNSTTTQCSKRPAQKRRKLSRMTFRHHGKPVCRETFKYLHCISQDKLSRVKKDYLKGGFSMMNTKRRKGAVNPNSLTPGDLETAVRFVINFAEQQAVFLPGRIPGTKRTDVRLLPSCYNKSSVWRIYKTAMESEGKRAMACSTFRKMWRMYTPQVMTSKPMTDLCWKCQQNNTLVYRSANLPEEEKRQQLKAQEEHLRQAKLERTLYQQMVAESKSVLPAEVKQLSAKPACSFSRGPMHYSFDFAQQVHYPSDPMQPGPVYFLTPRKCGVFGITCEAIPQQIIYLIDEGMSHLKGSIAVTSYLHHFFRAYGMGEQILHLHCDNCSGQNKNKYVMWYLSWRCLNGFHKEITLNFLIAGHTKFAPDWGFGLFKTAYRRTSVSTLQDIADMVTKSTPSGCNIPQLVGSESGDQFVPTYDWQAFLTPYFKAVPGIKSYHHFRFSSSDPGVVFCKELADSPEVKHQLLQDFDHLPPRMLPASQPVPGLSKERQQYLYSKIREFCHPEARDITCPKPKD